MVDKYVKFIQKAAYGNNIWQWWNDFITLFALALQIPFSPHLSEERRRQYRIIYDSYSKEAILQFGHLMDMLLEDWEKSTACDILGEIYTRLSLTSHAKGQYFTPYIISEFMAKIVSTEEHELPIIFNEPACGSGSNIIAFANELKARGINYQEDAYFIAEDIDPLVAMMCYIQMSLFGMPGVVRIGDTLDIKNPKEHMYTPFHYIRGPRIFARLQCKQRKDVKIVSAPKEDEENDEDMSWFYDLIGME